MTPQGLARAQGTYFFVTGVWPLLSMRTFEAVTGPKRDRWLVKTVGVLVAVIGASLATVRRPVPPTMLLALGSAAGLAVLEALLIAGWLAALRRRRP